MNLSSFLQISDWDNHIIIFIYKSVLFYFLAVGITSFSLSYFILYLYDTFGIIEAGKYLLLVNVVMFSFDYLTGNLSDTIGQQGVMSIALITHALAFVVLASTTNLIYLYGAEIIQGFALAQFSGRFMTWFDNIYKEIAEKYDVDYKIYPYYFNEELNL